LEDQDLKLIFNAIESGRCLAFLGAGACTAFRRPNGEEEPGLPAGKQLDREDFVVFQGGIV